MGRRNIHRGIAGLAIVTSMAFAGARPAAASSLGFFDRVAHFWSAVAAPGTESLWSTMTGWFTEKATAAPDTSERGWGLDPNGNSATTEPVVTGVSGS